MTEDKKEKKREKFSVTEREILLSLIETGQDGKFKRLLTKGTTTNYEMHKVWIDIAAEFNMMTERCLDYQQVSNYMSMSVNVPHPSKPFTEPRRKWLWAAEIVIFYISGESTLQ